MDTRRRTEQGATRSLRDQAGRRRRWAAVPVALGVTLLAAACGGPYGGASAAGSTGSSSPSGTGAVVAVGSTGLGSVLVDGRGRTTYEFALDTRGVSHCTGVCAQNWPPVAAPDQLPASLPGVSGTLGVTNRSDGVRQLTVAGHPVYTYSGDDAAGQTNGQGITLDGGVWNAVSSAGAPIPAGASAPSSSSY